MSMTQEERKARLLEQKRRWREANKEANKEKEAERQRRWREANKDKQLKQQHRWRETNKEKHSEMKRRWLRRKGFSRENGSSFEAWVSSVRKPALVFEVIANLQPDPGQTLAELIHELSGYAMEVCEQIANPTVIDDTPALTPPPAEDLF